MASQIRIGTIVLHPRKPEWGPGKVLAIQDGFMTVYFRDDRDCDTPNGTRTLSSSYPVEVAPVQSDRQLDNLPPFDKGKFGGHAARPVRLHECLEWFRQEYPLGFRDPAYIGKARKGGERAYKWEAHERWEKTLDGGAGRVLLHKGCMEELTGLALAVDNKVNLLSKYEKMALRDALQESAAATRYFEALFNLLDSGKPTEQLFVPYVRAVADLPAEEGKARVNSWPVATLFPFMARPDHFMFLKPKLTCEVAEIMNFDLHYNATPNWLTYAKLMELADLLMERLREFGAQDMIDVQSFMYLVHVRGSKL